MHKLCTLASTGACPSASPSRYNAGCRATPCKAANTAYHRNHRAKDVAAMTKTRKTPKPDSNIVAMPTMHRQSTSSNLRDLAAPPVAAPDDDLLLEIMAHLDEVGVVNRALRARVRKLCSILANDDLRGHWVSAAKHLDELLVRIEGPAKRKKANQGRLAIIQQMSAKNDANRLDAMNAMNRKTAK
jgi:hypothetical protein